MYFFEAANATSILDVGFLGEAVNTTAQQIQKAILGNHAAESHNIHLVKGAAGTGKTTCLMSIAEGVQEVSKEEGPAALPCVIYQSLYAIRTREQFHQVMKECLTGVALGLEKNERPELASGTSCSLPRRTDVTRPGSEGARPRSLLFLLDDVDPWLSKIDQLQEALEDAKQAFQDRFHSVQSTNMVFALRELPEEARLQLKSWGCSFYELTGLGKEEYRLLLDWLIQCGEVPTSAQHEYALAGLNALDFCTAGNPDLTMRLARSLLKDTEKDINRALVRLLTELTPHYRRLLAERFAPMEKGILGALSSFGAGASSSVLSERLGVAPNAMRAHLSRLEKKCVVEKLHAGGIKVFYRIAGRYTFLRLWLRLKCEGTLPRPFQDAVALLMDCHRTPSAKSEAWFSIFDASIEAGLAPFRERAMRLMDQAVYIPTPAANSEEFVREFDTLKTNLEIEGSKRLSDVLEGIDHLFPLNANCCIYKGCFLGHELGFDDLAALEFQTACQLDPKGIFPALNRAIALIKLHRFDEAEFAAKDAASNLAASHEVQDTGELLRQLILRAHDIPTARVISYLFCLLASEDDYRWLVSRRTEISGFSSQGVVMAFGLLGATETVPTLLHRLEQEPGPIKVTIINALGAMEWSEDTELSVMGCLQDVSTMVRIAACNALGAKGSTRCLEILEQKLNDQVSRVRSAVVNALGKIAQRHGLVLGPLVSETWADDSSAVRASALRALRNADHFEASELAKCLGEESSEVRTEAALALGRSGGVDAVSHLASAIQHPDSLTRASIAIALGLTNQESAIGPLIKLSFDKDKIVCSRALLALGQLRARSAGLMIKEHLTSASPYVRSAALAVLSEVGYEGPLEPVLTCLQHASEEVRGNAIRALERIRVKEAAPHIERCLESSSTTLKSKAIWALGVLRTNVSAMALVPKLSDPSPKIRAMAGVALARIDTDVALHRLQTMLDKDHERQVRRVILLVLLKLAPQLVCRDAGTYQPLFAEAIRVLPPPHKEFLVRRMCAGFLQHAAPEQIGREGALLKHEEQLGEGFFGPYGAAVKYITGDEKRRAPELLPIETREAVYALCGNRLGEG